MRKLVNGTEQVQAIVRACMVAKDSSRLGYLTQQPTPLLACLRESHTAGRRRGLRRRSPRLYAVRPGDSFPSCVRGVWVVERQAGGTLRRYECCMGMAAQGWGRACL